MKKLLLVAAVGVTACAPAPQASTVQNEHKPLKCKGEFTEVHGQKVTIECDDGIAFTYTSYKYSMTRRQGK